MSRPAWLVGDMDNGVLRIEATRTDALRWAKRDACADRVTRRYHYGSHNYGYVLASNNPDDCTSRFIGRIDTAHLQGYHPQQMPLYPIQNQPYTLVEPAADITATVPDSNSQDVILAAWATAATAAGLAVAEQYVANLDEYLPTRAKVNGRWYELECYQRDSGFVVTACRWT